jgi:hypothetical protein
MRFLEEVSHAPEGRGMVHGRGIGRLRAIRKSSRRAQKNPVWRQTGHPDSILSCHPGFDQTRHNEILENPVFSRKIT